MWEESTLLEESDKERCKQTGELRLWGLEQLKKLQTEEHKNKKFNAEFNSINDEILHKENIIKKCKDAIEQDEKHLLECRERYQKQTLRGEKATWKTARRNADSAEVARTFQGDQGKNAQNTLWKQFARTCDARADNRRHCENWCRLECSEQVCRTLCCPAFFNIFKEKMQQCHLQIQRHEREASVEHTQEILERAIQSHQDQGVVEGYVGTLLVAGSDRRGLKSPMRQELVPATPTQQQASHTWRRIHRNGLGHLLSQWQPENGWLEYHGDWEWHRTNHHISHQAAHRKGVRSWSQRERADWRWKFLESNDPIDTEQDDV